MSISLYHRTGGEVDKSSQRIRTIPQHRLTMTSRESPIKPAIRKRAGSSNSAGSQNEQNEGTQGMKSQKLSIQGAGSNTGYVVKRPDSLSARGARSFAGSSRGSNSDSALEPTRSMGAVTGETYPSLQPCGLSRICYAVQQQGGVALLFQALQWLSW